MGMIVQDIKSTVKLLKDTTHALMSLSRGQLWSSCTDHVVSNVERACLHAYVNNLANAYVELLMLVEEIGGDVPRRLQEAAEKEPA